MPAWGKSHVDRLIWDLVAFLQQLPALSSAQYGDTPRRGDPDRQGRDPGGAAAAARPDRARRAWISAVRTLRSAEHTSELQSLMRTSYAVFCLNKKNTYYNVN